MKNRLPPWFKQDLPQNSVLSRQHFLSSLGVKTVCKEARCPNLGECLRNSRLTFMLLGSTCTRECRFCEVEKAGGEKLAIVLDEPQRIAKAVNALGLTYVVLTSVTRDDLEDGGAGIFAQTIALLRAQNKAAKIEVLIPDFKGDFSGLKSVIEAGPQVIGHNLETVKRLYPLVRPQADYALSLAILEKVKEHAVDIFTKSSLMLGLGEIEDEVRQTLEDLKEAGCDILTLGQYLAPSSRHFPVKDFIDPQRFMRYKELAVDLGFKAVLAGPLVRSSYQAEELYNSLTNGSFQSSVFSHQLKADS